MSRATYVRGTLEQRFWPKVDKSGDCWVWTAATIPGGYGYVNIGSHKMEYVHRVAYQLVVGPIPDGLQIDHLCRNRRCVNPEHLEAVTQRTNLLRGEGAAGVRARQTHCKRGHAFDEKNTGIHSLYGTRKCRACDAEAKQRQRTARKAAANG